MFTTRRSVVYKSLRRRRKKRHLGWEKFPAQWWNTFPLVHRAHTHGTFCYVLEQRARRFCVEIRDIVSHLDADRLRRVAGPDDLYLHHRCLYIFSPFFFCSCCPAQKKNKQENNEMRWRRRSVGWFMTSKWAVQTRWASFLFVYFSVVVSLYVTATRGEKRGCVRLCAGRNACLLRLRWTNVSALTRFRCVERKRERLFLPACIYIYSLVVVENEWKTV